ncbi:long-chain-fatty-acid--CoA ligase [Actinomadura sp. HBU206391]|uniref:long-chain-fatty-acid--CoA ligase n=1 Tax=Actinomadura sp. HBU206391 TaxID=2731692 RepID=UPI00164FAEE6|nr:long-chain-fatty-acid--CoA ligase [Actinomadura sp. HBU206391]MBC6457149.1 long-chain-fatty-acid--CoA ligase [Actinomadura sp. HBU206391]
MSLLTDVLRDRTREIPDQIAFISGDERVTYAEFDRRVHRAANALRAAGVERGDRVAILDKNSIEYVEQLFAAARLGAVQVPVNYRLSADEVAYVVNDAQAPVFLVGREFVPLLDAIADRLEHTEHLVVVGTGEHAYQDYAAWVGAYDATPVNVELSSDDVFAQLYSSGTTGLPKGVMLTHDNFVGALRPSNRTWSPEPSSVLMVAMPAYHIAGCILSISVIYDGITGVIVSDPDPGLILDAISEHGVTHTFLVPVLLLFMPQMPQAQTADLSSLRVMLYGASPISDDVLRGAMRLMPHTDFMQVYGLTETTGAITMLPPADHTLDGPNTHRLRSAGLPTPETELRIVDPATGDELPTGQVGEILSRTEQNMRGYWRLPEASSQTMLPDGWLRTGDIGYLDEDGYLYIHDRVKDMIISGGENIYPAEVENVLMSHPQVADCAIIGVPDPKWGETPKAFVVVSGEVTDQELIDHCRERLAHFKCPTSIERSEAIPRNPTGKVLKRDLRAPYWADQDRAVH